MSKLWWRGVLNDWRGAGAVVGLLACTLLYSPASSAGFLRTPDAAAHALRSDHPRAAAVVTFSGVVQDAATKAPIVGAKVTFGQVSTLTDSSGHYTLNAPAGKAFHATAAAPGYLPVAVDLSANGALLNGAVHWDFTGAYGLKALGNLTAVLSGLILDAQTNAAVGGAAVMAPGAHTTADAQGHYQLTVASTPRLQLLTAALGYQWRPPLTLSPVGGATLQGQLSFDFKGSDSGMWSAFKTPQGDTLSRISQVVPARTRVLSFSGSSSQDMESSFAATFPRGDADLFALTVAQGHYAGKLPFTHGKGVYQLEINAGNGFAIFNLPVYYGVPYAPPPVPPLYPAANPAASPMQLEAEALGVLNGVRARYHRALFIMVPALEQEARAHSVDVVFHNYYDQHPHIGSNGSTPEDRVKTAQIPYNEIGEDVAADSSIRGAIDGLMRSPGHRANILLRQFTRVGIGVARQGGNTLILTVDFVHPV